MKRRKRTKSLKIDRKLEKALKATREAGADLVAGRNSITQASRSLSEPYLTRTLAKAYSDTNSAINELKAAIDRIRELQGDLTY